MPLRKSESSQISSENAMDIEESGNKSTKNHIS